MLPKILSGSNRPDSNTSPLDARRYIMEAVSEMLKSHTSFGIAADFDQNISTVGKNKGHDPRDSSVHPVARGAIVELLSAGIDFVVITSRGAKDARRIININDADLPGRLAYVGSLGWETLCDGESQIHPQFEPHRENITNILKAVRSRFFTEHVADAPEVGDEPNLKLHLKAGGIIILQRKGFNKDYPEGISLTWNLNQVTVQQQPEVVMALEERYYQALREFSGDELESIKKLCGIVHRQDSVNGFYDLEMRPISQAAKAQAMAQLLQEQDTKREPHFRHMPSHDAWIYSGDHATQDGPVMQAGKLVYQLTGGKKTVVGIWSKPEAEDIQLVRGVDATVDGVEGNVALLKEIADLISVAAASLDTTRSQGSPSR